ncbi:MAG TPA: hypothetical protein VHU40_11390 [Polyangia bacterium]|jgi:hypothetical protein|nr:hypothetical protein [Polyangia bacterium]
MSQLVTASFGSVKQARRAVHNLLEDHFPREHIRARGPGFSPPLPREPLGQVQKDTAQWGGGMGAGLGGMWGALIGLMTFALPAESGVMQPLAALLGGALLGALLGGGIGAVLGVRAPSRPSAAVNSRPIVVAVEAETPEEAERAEADLLNVVGPFPPKIHEGASAPASPDRALH